MSETAIRTNGREQACSECEGLVPVGQGHLWWEAGPDDGGDVVGRTPAGWRVTHLDPEVCRAERLALSKGRTEQVEGSRAKAAAARVSFEVELGALRAEVEREAAELGLVNVPEDGCTAPARLAGEKLSSRFDRSIYPEGGGFSRGWSASVTEYVGGIVASIGQHEGATKQWASAVLVERGLRQYRIAQWWSPVGYSADSYPGPAVLEAELTEEERVDVARLRAAATRARLDKERCSALASIDRVLGRDFAGATWETTIDESELADFVEANRVRYSKESEASSMTARVVLRRPATGRKRGGKPTARPPYEVTVKIHHKLTAMVSVTEVA